MKAVKEASCSTPPTPPYNQNTRHESTFRTGSLSSVYPILIVCLIVVCILSKLLHSGKKCIEGPAFPYE